MDISRPLPGLRGHRLFHFVNRFEVFHIGALQAFFVPAVIVLINVEVSTALGTAPVLIVFAHFHALPFFDFYLLISH